MSSDRLQMALERFDNENAKDPNQERVDNREVAKEWIYGRRMSATLERFAPAASEVVHLAVRAQHLRRWESPRTDYPAGREGYLRWRSDLGKMHGELAAAIAREVGYEEEVVERLARVVRKKGYRSDVEAQQVEDVACLVFLEHYYADFAAKHDDAKIVDILRKTWAKMSEAGHAAALTLPLGGREKELVDRALSG